MFKAVERATDILSKNNLEGFDVYAIVSKGYKVAVKEDVDEIKVSDEKGIAIRLVADRKMGFVYTNDVSDDGLKVAIECAKDNASVAVPDDYSFSTPSPSLLDFSLEDADYRGINLNERINLAKDLKDKVFSIDSRIKRIRKSTYSDSLTGVYYHNSNDNSFNYKTTNFALSIMTVAEQSGKSQMGWDVDLKRFFKELNPSRVAKNAVQSAVELLGAEPVPTMNVPVIFKNTVFAELLGALSSAFLGSNVLRRKTMFADKLGQQVASHVFTLYDDPTVRDGAGSVPYDDEGTATRKKAIIERGELRNFLLDIYFAQKLGEKSTGNCVRASVSSIPLPGITNLVVENGAPDLVNMTKTPESVLLVTDAMGIHTVNPISGEFSIAVSGLFYKDGKLVQPVMGVTVAGNVKDILNGITEVGRDSKWMGNICSPSVLIKTLTVSGK